MRNVRTLAIFAACTLLVIGCGVNKSIRIADGETVNGGRATVNGNVFIGVDCTVRGDCRTVNGGVTVGSGSEVGGLQSVNGSIKIAENVSVDGEVGTVNGSIRLAENVSIEGDVETVNGSVFCKAGGIITGHNNGQRFHSPCSNRGSGRPRHRQRFDGPGGQLEGLREHPHQGQINPLRQEEGNRDHHL